MKYNQKHTFRHTGLHAGVRKTLALLLLAMFASSPLLAQDASDKRVHTIEVRDGKVWVNGEAVTELDDDGRKIVFKHGEDGEVIAFGDDFHDAFAFGDLFDRARFHARGDADFTVRNGNFARYFADESENQGSFMVGFGNDPLIGSFGDSFSSAEVMKMEQEARRLAQRIRREDGDVSQLEEELDDTLERIFDLKVESRAERVEHLESQLQELQDRIEQRKTDREMIIEQRKQELLGRHDRYEW